MANIKVQLIKDHPEGFVYGAPKAAKGEVLEVKFKVGAELIAAEFAVPAPEESKKSKDKKEQ